VESILLQTGYTSACEVNMKKLFYLVMVLVVLAMLSACSKNKDEDENVFVPVKDLVVSEF
jgi:hypothetical protein